MENAAGAKKKRDGRQHRADGERSRQAILKAASELATLEGLAGLSIGRLAEYVGMSKSGLFAHFKSKEELQLAAIDTAAETVKREVLDPAWAAEPGLARVYAFCDAYFSHLDRRVFPGGCFFISVAAEFDGKEGPVREYAMKAYLEVLKDFREMIAEPREAGEIDPKEDIDQLMFELDSFMLCVNFAMFFFRDPGAIGRGRAAVRQRIERALSDRGRGRSR